MSGQFSDPIENSLSKNTTARVYIIDQSYRSSRAVLLTAIHTSKETLFLILVTNLIEVVINALWIPKKLLWSNQQLKNNIQN